MPMPSPPKPKPKPKKPKAAKPLAPRVNGGVKGSQLAAA